MLGVLGVQCQQQTSAASSWLQPQRQGIVNPVSTINHPLGSSAAQLRLVCFAGMGKPPGATPRDSDQLALWVCVPM
eukprot:COSAG01_NODE_5881_length_3971_cov_6.184353_2_plen_76_part_00